MTITVDNSTVDFPAILRADGLHIATNGTCFCPFHEDDNHRSAKVFQDTDGWRLWCWVCGQQFRPADYYKKLRKDGMIDEDVVVIGDENEEEFEAIDTGFLDGFKTGEMTVEQLCRAIFDQKRERTDQTGPEGTGNVPETGKPEGL